MDARSSILGAGTQIAPQNIRYAGNVPLFISAFKQYRDLQYSEWELSELHLVTDKYNVELFEWVGVDILYTAEELQELSLAMRTDATGKQKGKPAPASSFNTRKTDNFEFNELPKFVKLLICQTWAYQPTCASAFAIRNLQDIDAPAVPLISTELFSPKPKKLVQEEEVKW